MQRRNVRILVNY